MRTIIRLATVATRSGSGPPASGGSRAAAASPSADMTRILGPAGGIEDRAVPKAIWVRGDVFGDLGTGSDPDLIVRARRGDSIEQLRERCGAEPAEHERVQDDRHVAAVSGQPVDLRFEPGTEVGRLDRLGRSADLFACRAERRQNAAGVYISPLEGQQGEAVLETDAGAGRRAVTQTGLAQDCGAPIAELAARRTQASDLQVESTECGEAPLQVGGLLGHAQLRPLLVAPGVEGNLVTARVDLAQQVGVDLRVQALGFVEHRQAAVQRPGPGLEMDGDAGNADPGAEGGEATGVLAVARRGGEHQWEVGGPHRHRAAPADERLKDEADPGPGLEGVVGEQAQGRSSREKSSYSHPVQPSRAWSGG